MKNEINVKIALGKAIEQALKKHVEEVGTLKTLDWFNISDKTTDFYISLNKEVRAA